jgi:hypothetical protein
MTTLALLLGGVLAAASVVYVARPFLREPSLAPGEDRLAELGPEGARRLALVQERDRALDALKELELDHQSGKISDEDYRVLVGALRADAARALRALDRAGPPA